jgi:hypothetical protein
MIPPAQISDGLSRSGWLDEGLEDPVSKFRPATHKNYLTNQNILYIIGRIFMYKFLLGRYPIRDIIITTLESQLPSPIWASALRYDPIPPC